MFITTKSLLIFSDISRSYTLTDVLSIHKESYQGGLGIFLEAISLQPGYFFALNACQAFLPFFFLWTPFIKLECPAHATCVGHIF